MYIDRTMSKETEKYRKDPSKFLEDFFGIEFFPYQKELIKYMTKEN